MIEFAVETFAIVRDEIWPLWQLHYDEIAQDKETIPLDPDWDKYDHLAEAGNLHIVTARKDGTLVGYTFNIVSTHLHYRTTLFAFSDLYYLHPAHRGGRTAARMFCETEKSLKALGVVKAVSNTKLTHNHGRLFEALGWRRAEHLYVKTLGA